MLVINVKVDMQVLLVSYIPHTPMLIMNVKVDNNNNPLSGKVDQCVKLVYPGLIPEKFL